MVFSQLRKALCFLEKVGQLPPVSWRCAEEGLGAPQQGPGASPMWQLYIQMRWPSYRVLHFMTLLV